MGPTPDVAQPLRRKLVVWQILPCYRAPLTYALPVERQTTSQLGLTPKKPDDRPQWLGYRCWPIDTRT